MRVKRKIKIKMRKIKASQIKDKIKELFSKANYYISKDLMNQLQEALEQETSPLSSKAL